MDPSNPHYHYAQHALESDSLQVNPSSTGNDPLLSGSNNLANINEYYAGDDIHQHGKHTSAEIPTLVIEGDDSHGPSAANSEDVGGREIYGLNDEDGAENIGNLPSRSNNSATFNGPQRTLTRSGTMNPNLKKTKAPSSFPSVWIIYCWALTWWIPPPLMKLCGMPDKDRQLAWREKIGLISIILMLAAIVAYLTFGFTKTVCKATSITIKSDDINTGYLVINGRAFDLTSSTHPKAAGITKNANILYPPINAGGKDASFLFQNVNGNCKNLITPKDNCSIPYNDDNELAWYFPCKIFDVDGSSTPNFTETYYNGWGCHTSAKARKTYYNLDVTGKVYFDWDDVKNASRNLVVYNGDVLDLDLLSWLDTDNVNYPKRFDDLKNDNHITGYDVSLQMSSSSDKKIAKCLQETIRVGVVNSTTIGCIASKIVLVVSLVFILAIVIIKFCFACYFHWFVAGKQGAYYMDNATMNKRANELEDWSATPNLQGPIKKSPSSVSHKSKWYERKQSRFANFDNLDQEMTTMSTQLAAQAKQQASRLSKRNSSFYNNNSSSFFAGGGDPRESMMSGAAGNPFDSSTDPNAPIIGNQLSYELIHPKVLPQPPAEYQPFGYPLPHTILLITAYSESVEGLRTTCDSLATTDYPNSHKMLLIICDGIIKGSGNDKTTPEICLDLMEDFLVPIDDVQPHSYVAVAQGSKRHNMAKVYSGFYKYDNDTVPPDKQQRVPVVCIVKCGTPQEEGTAKPGNRGKRDTQIILMSFLQHLMFDERMTELEYEILSNFWGITGLFADLYEIVLMVDADTKVYPDSVTHMVAEMVKDPKIMGLCGETKISNKRQSWVTAIQVFEYYISHHQAKAFESIFGGVTCLPGCFCMYRIKAPKGSDGYWVPILANPDIVERYADNVTDSLHKKNLLLLGEDRYLTSLMLRNFPKRKQIFVPKACCKTIVPDEFSVLLSQRRRWINSTVHNLMELVLVKDLCGVFCFSMQFVVFIELIGTLVLPAAIAFTLYVVVEAFIDISNAVLSLVLLAMILGLPGLLIVITASRWSYVLWMIIYLCALVIWNFVLPSYAFWKFDDFSWGQTREIAGGSAANKGHDQGEGEFDSSKIVMKRWRDFERERRRDGYLSQPPTAWDPNSAANDNTARSPANEEHDADVSRGQGELLYENSLSSDDESIEQQGLMHQEARHRDEYADSGYSYDQTQRL